jgi:predicted transport protein
MTDEDNTDDIIKLKDSLEELKEIIHNDKRAVAEEMQSLFGAFGIRTTLVTIKLSESMLEVGVALPTSQIEKLRLLLASIMTESDVT